MSSPTVPGITSPTKQSPTTTTKPNRLPAPTLFVGPPSRNTSQLSVARPALAREKSARSRIYNVADANDVDGGDNTARQSPPPPVPTLRKKPSDKSVDAKWREMQSTLNEVELTAQQSSTHVFGESHAAALDELRNAQIALAKAWGRGSEKAAAEAAAGGDAQELNVDRFKGAEELATDRGKTVAVTASPGGAGGGARKRADTEASASTVLSDESVLTEASGKSGGSGWLEDETAQDIKLASERRAANEAYFKNVDRGVKEVVEKLEKVAEAMRGVEGESRSLWSNSDRVSSSGSEGGRGKRVVTAPVGNG